jgi:hypothetical protein
MKIFGNQQGGCNPVRLMVVDLKSHRLARVAWSPVGRNVVGVDSTLWFDLLALFTPLAMVAHGRIFKVRRVVVLCHPRLFRQGQIE